MPSFYDSNMTELNDDIYEATLKINQVSQSSYGDYICKGQNTMGAKRTIIKLQVRIGKIQCRSFTIFCYATLRELQDHGVIDSNSIEPTCYGNF